MADTPNKFPEQEDQTDMIAGILANEGLVKRPEPKAEPAPQVAVPAPQVTEPVVQVAMPTPQVVEPKPQVVEPPKAEPVAATPPPSAQPVAVPAPAVDELTALREQNEALLKRLDAAYSGKPAEPAVPAKPVVEPAPAPAVVQQVAQAAAAAGIELSDEEYEVLFADKGMFIDLVNKVVERVLATKKAPEPTLQVDLESRIDERIELKNSIEHFFAENSDLARVRSYVGSVVAELARTKRESGQQASVQDILKEAGELTRKELRLDVLGKAAPNPGNPAFAPTVGAAPPAIKEPAPQLNAEEARISGIVSYLKER